VNRLFRSAFVPLIVIVVLVWLASQTLIPKKNNADPAIKTYSQLIGAVQAEPQQFTEVVFNPAKRAITATEAGGRKVTVHYPSDQSQVAFQQVLQKKGVNFDSKGTGGFSWTSLLGSILPFILLIGFWIFLMNQVQGGGS
jgi:cell division protease FtsH